MNKFSLTHYLLTFLLLSTSITAQPNTIGTYIDAMIAPLSNTIVFGTHALYQRIKHHNKIKTTIATLQKNNQSYVQLYQKKLIDKYHQAIRNLCIGLNLDPQSFIDQLQTKLKDDLHQLSLPLTPQEAPAFHSKKIPLPIKELIFTLLRRFNINPDRIEIDITTDYDSANVNMDRSKFREVKRRYQLFIPESYFNLSLFEIEGIIIHEIAHIMLGHLIFDENIYAATQKTKEELINDHSGLVTLAYFIKITHVSEFMADLYISVTNPTYIFMLKKYYKSECLYDLEEIFQPYWSHPSMFSRIKKLQKAALYLDYEHQSKITQINT